MRGAESSARPGRPVSIIELMKEKKPDTHPEHIALFAYTETNIKERLVLPGVISSPTTGWRRWLFGEPPGRDVERLRRVTGR